MLHYSPRITRFSTLEKANYRTKANTFRKGGLVNSSETLHGATVA